MELHTARLAVAFALVAIIFPSTFSAPATRSTCTPVCRKSHESRINYQDGKTYTYGFETEVVTQVVGTSDETSRIKVKGQAVIAAQSSCDFVLTVQQVALQSPSGQVGVEAISRVDDIEGSSLRFSYQHGEIESICVSEDDPTWSANVKRAIVSMLSNKANRANENSETIETDISGNCPTVYTVSGNKFTKTRNLNSCTHRDGGASVFFGVPYDVSSKYNSLPVIDSSLTCNQEINADGVFQLISCVEDHKLAGLSTSSSGVQTQIKSSLSLVSTQDGLQKGSRAATRPSTIFFDHADIDEPQRQKTSASRAVDFLNKLCQEVESGTVSSKVPGLYLQLRKSLKSARKEDVKQMYEQITSGRLCSKATEKLGKLFVDAAASSASDGAIAFLVEIITNGQAEPHTENLFNMFTTFAPRPGVVALQAAESLISRSEVDSKYLLTASGLAHQYCKITNPKCVSNNEYHSLVDKIAQHVRSANDEESTRKVVAALQALGNLDQLTPAATTAIHNLLKDKSTSERLKVRALDAFRRNPCQEQLKEKALKIFSNIKESSHVRIQAYLTLTKCVHQTDVQALQVVLDSEKSNQVGSFVYSHIENVLGSTSPGKKEIKNVFRQLTFPKEFARDSRKFSRNIELSTFSPDLNIGGSLDGNLIFSQDSFLPRTTTANLTIDAFGRSYNFLELGIYAEDFEHLVEKYFGPAGKIRKTNLEDILHEGANKLSKLTERIRNRFRRDVNVNANENEIESIHEKVHIEERIGDQGHGDVYLRIMGTSVVVDSFSEDQIKKRSLSQELKRGFEKIVDGAKDHKFDLTEPFMFVDDEVTIPTFSGLPLNLHLEGTSVLSLQMQGNLDLPALFRGEGLSDMRARIVPSAASTLKARMTVGTGPIESGLQLEGKFHSASGVDLKVVKEDGKFEVRFNIPQERTQVVDIRSDLYWVEQPQDSLEKKTPVKSKLSTMSPVDNECIGAFSKILGLKVCADIKIPKASRDAPFIVLNGPSVLSLTVEKSEASMEGYYLKVEKDTHDEENCGINFLMDTPGSRTNRKISASLKGLKYKSNTPEYIFKLESPWTELDVEYKRSFTDQLKGVHLKVVHDGEAFTGKVQLKKVTAGTVNKYEPVIQYTISGGKPVNIVEGHIIRVEDKRVEIDLRTSGPLKSARGSIKGIIEMPRRDANGFELVAKNLQLSSELVGKLNLDAKVARTNKVLESKIQAKYGDTAQHNFEFESKVGMPTDSQLVIKAKSQSSRVNFLNFDLDGEITKGPNSYKTIMTYTRGVTEPKIKITHKLDVQVESRRKFNVLNEIVVKYPSLNVDLYTLLDATAAPGQARHAEVTFNVNSLKSGFRYESAGQSLLDYSVNGHAKFSGKTYEFSEVSTKVADQKQNFKSRIAVTPGFWYAADTDVIYKFEKSDIESSISSTITSDQLEQPIIFKSGVKGKSDAYAAMLKLDMKGENYVDVLTQFKHSKAAKPATLNVKAFVIEYLDAKLTQTLTRQDANMDFEAKWLPTGRKITADSKLNAKGEDYNLNAHLKWDADGDVSKAASLKSLTTLSFSNWHVDSKNDITILDRTSKVNVRGTAMKDFLNGEDNLEVSYTTPEGKTYSVATVLNLENKLKIKAGKINVKVNLPGEKPYDLTWENRVSNLDFHQLTFEAVTDLKFDYKGEKDVKLRAELGSIIPGNHRTYNAKLEASGSVIPKPLSADLNLNIKTGKWAIKGSANRGERKGDFDATIEYDKWAPKKTLSIQYAVNTPYDRFKSVEGVSKYTFLYSSCTNFEISEDSSYTVNHESPVHFKCLASILENEFKFNNEFINEGQTSFGLSASGKLTGKKLISSLETIYRGDKSTLDIDIDHQLPNLALHVKGASPYLQVKGKDGNFDLKATHKKTGDGIYETDVLAKSVNELAFRITNKLEVSAQRKSIDLFVSTAEEPTRRLYLLLNELQTNKYNVEALIRWGDGGKFFNSKGELTRSQESFDATMTLESPELKASKFNVKVSKKNLNGRRTVDLKVQENNQERFSAEVDFGQKETRSGAQKTYDGSIKVKGDGSFHVDFIGKFNVEDTKLERQIDSEEGRQFRASFEVTSSDSKPFKGSAVAKSSDKEKRLQASYCNEEKFSCKSGDIHFKHQHEDNGDLEYSLRVIGESEDNGEKSAAGVSFRTASSEHGRQLEHTTKLILTKDKTEQVGYKLYRKNGNEMGAEILLPERVIAAVFVVENPKSTDLKLDLSFYIDKIRQPTRKINIILNTVKHQRSSGVSRDTEVILRHPDISKDLKIQTKYTIGGEKSLLDVETVLDIFKADSEIKIAYKTVKEVLTDGHLYKSEWSVVSKGQHINFGGKSELSRADGRISYKQVLNYENRDNQVKTTKIETLFSLNRLSVEVEGPTSKLVSILSSFDKHPTGYEVRQEVLLPGMEDARIFQSVVSTTSPSKLQVKSYTTNSPSGIYYEAFLGFKNENEDHFVVGLYDHESDGNKVLADFNVALNNSRILTIKADWERNNIRHVWTKVQNRADRTKNNLRQLVVSSVEEVVKEIQFVGTNLRKASPNLNVALNSAKDKLADLIVELDAHEETKILMDQVRTAQGYFKQYLKFMVELTKVVRRMTVSAVHSLREALRTLPELMKQYVDKIPYTMEDVQDCVEKVIDTLVDASRKMIKLLGQTVERISAASPEIIKRINWALDFTSGAGECIQKYLGVALDEVVVWWKNIRSCAKDFIENETVQMIFKDVIITAEIMVSEFIEESKIHAESFKNYILRAVPQEDFHAVVESIAEYVEKKARNQNVDDVAAIKDIYEKIVVVLKKVGAEIFTVDINGGIMIAKIPLPMPIKSLSELAKVFEGMSIPRPPTVNYRVPMYSFGIRESINKIRNGASIDQLVPPFDAYGLLVGSQYYKTFDGKFFRFEGNCQYLLASDFDDGNFTLVVDYDNKGSSVQKSLIVKDSKDTVAIKPDSTVFVNGQQVNIDNQVEAGSFKVERMGDWIVVHGAAGVKVGCSVSQDVCAIKISGYYHGKILGLLGKFNQEQFDDMSTPEGELVESIENLAKSWKIENQCSEQPISSLQVISSTVRDNCAKAFDSKYSSLRPCYGVVQPRDYQTMCENLSVTKGYDTTRALCTSSLGYAKACKLSFANVETIEECRTA